MPLQIRRGPTADRVANIPLAGELVFDTTTGSVYIGNGTTAGGLPVTNFSVGDARSTTATMFLGDSLNDNTVHSGITFAYIGNRLQATVQQDLSNYIGLIGADQGFAGNLWADDSGLIVNSETRTVYGNFVPQGHIIPETNVAYDLGSAAYRFRDLYLSGSTIYLGSAAITSTGTAIDFPVGSTVGGQALGINEGDAYNIVLSGNVIGADSTVLVNTANGTFHGDLTGSVFADDSTILVDGRDGVLRGTLIGSLTGNVTGNLTGTASSATIASTVTLVPTNLSASTHYISFTANSNGDESVRTDTGLTYQPSTNTLTVGNISGSITGNILTTLIDSADSSAITVASAAIFSSDVTIENELFIGGDVFPGISESYNLGSYTKKFNKLYLAEGANALWIGNAAISGSGTAINLPAGSTVGGSAITTAAGANATTITVNTTGTSADHFVSFFDDQTGDNLIYTDDTFKYNPGTGVLTVGDATIGTVTGNLVGNVTGNTTGVHTGFVDGDVKGSVFADDSSVMVNAIDRTLIGTLTGNVTGRITASASSTVTDGGAFILGSNTVTGSLYIRGNTASNQIRLGLYSNTSTDTQRLAFERYRGTIAAPLAVQSGDRLGDLRWTATDNSSTFQIAGAIRCEADANPTSNAVPGLMRLMTGNRITGTVTTAITIDSDQIVTVIKDLSVDGSLTVNAALRFDNNQISTVTTNADIEIQPNGTGKVDVRSDLEAVGSIKSSGTSGIGYAVGAGGTVTQAGSKTAGVTLDKICGQITTTADSIGSGSSASFTLTNSTISENDVVYVSIKSGASVAGAYTIFCDAVANGSCRISVFNLSGSAKTDTLVINYSVIKSVNS